MSFFKNPAHGRQRISWLMRIVRPIQFWRPEVCNPSESVVSTMFCKAKLRGDLRPLQNKKCSNLRLLLSITFPQGFRISKNIGHPTSGSEGKKTFKRYLKSEQTDGQTHRQTDISTSRKHRPRGLMLWKWGVQNPRSPPCQPKNRNWLTPFSTLKKSGIS